MFHIILQHLRLLILLLLSKCDISFLQRPIVKVVRLQFRALICGCLLNVNGCMRFERSLLLTMTTEMGRIFLNPRDYFMICRFFELFSVVNESQKTK